VPLSTVYDWARKEILVPSVSAVREKRRSYADLVALTIVYWLRHPKLYEQYEYAASPMPEVRRLLSELVNLDRNLWEPSNDGPRTPVLVDRHGRIRIADDDAVMTTDGQTEMPHHFDLLRDPRTRS
jgi:hypothetical protein